MILDLNHVDLHLFLVLSDALSEHLNSLVTGPMVLSRSVETREKAVRIGLFGCVLYLIT